MSDNNIYHRLIVLEYDPVLINLIRQVYPQIIAHSIVGVQPMTMPTGIEDILKIQDRETYDDKN